MFRSCDGVRLFTIITILKTFRRKDSPYYFESFGTTSATSTNKQDNKINLIDLDFSYLTTGPRHFRQGPVVLQKMESYGIISFHHPIENRAMKQPVKWNNYIKIVRYTTVT